MQRVGFTRMDRGTAADYALALAAEQQEKHQLPDARRRSMTCSRREVLQGAAGIPLALLAARPSGRFAFVQEPSVPDTAGVPDKEPRIELFERMAFGMFVHWGLYSQIGRGEWAKNSQGIATKDYMRLMQTFTAKEFSGRSLARVARRAGMKYVTLTSRHHDGFSLYGTQGLSPYDVTKTPAGRDLILGFVEGCREEGIVPNAHVLRARRLDARRLSERDAGLRHARPHVTA